MDPSFIISDLRQCPAFFDTVADRIWRAWWEPGGYPLAFTNPFLLDRDGNGSFDGPGLRGAP